PNEVEEAEVAALAGMDAQAARRVVHVIYPAVGGNDRGAIVKRCATTSNLVGGLFQLFRGHHLGDRTPASKTPTAAAARRCHHGGRGYCSASYPVAAS